MLAADEIPQVDEVVYPSPGPVFLLDCNGWQESFGVSPSESDEAPVIWAGGLYVRGRHLGRVVRIRRNVKGRTQIEYEPSRDREDE
jgi:hypothetical protein